MRKIVKTFDNVTSEIKLLSQRETIKTYGATAGELNDSTTTRLMDSENCVK